MIYYYEDMKQKEEPEIITGDTLKFILKQLDKENKKIGFETCSNGNKIISWLNNNKNISCVVCEPCKVK